MSSVLDLFSSIYLSLSTFSILSNGRAGPENSYIKEQVEGTKYFCFMHCRAIIAVIRRKQPILSRVAGHQLGPGGLLE